MFQKDMDNGVYITNKKPISCIQCHNTIGGPPFDTGPETKFGNGLKNTVVGLVGTFGSGYYVAQNGGVGAEIGGSVAFQLSLMEVAIRFGQMRDSFYNENPLIHTVSTGPGYISAVNNRQYRPLVDGVTGFITGILSGPKIISSGNIVGTIHSIRDLKLAKTGGSAFYESLKIYDGVMDTNGLIQDTISPYTNK